MSNAKLTPATWHQIGQLGCSIGPGITVKAFYKNSRDAARAVAEHNACAGMSNPVEEIGRLLQDSAILHSDPPTHESGETACTYSRVCGICPCTGMDDPAAEIAAMRECVMQYQKAADIQDELSTCKNGQRRAELETAWDVAIDLAATAHRAALAKVTK